MQSRPITTSAIAAKRIGCLMQELRKQRHITGKQIAQMVGISQSRVSKIENGYSRSINMQEVEALLNILKPTKIIRQQISMLALQLTSNSATQFAYPFTDMFAILNDLQKTTKVFRCYVSGVSAVLQTVEWRSALLKRLGLSEDEIHIESGKTIERQDALWDVSKTFHIVMPEAALYVMPATSQVQITQLDRLERILNTNNLRLGIIPMQAGVPFFETSSFTFYDDRILYVFMGDRMIQIEDPEVLVKYLNAFAEIAQMALFGTEALALVRKASDYFSGLS